MSYLAAESLQDWQNTRVLAAPQKLGRKEWTGSPSSFTFSPDGSQAMFLQSERLDASFSHDSIFLVDLMRPEIARCVTLSPAVASVPDDRSWPPRILTAHWDFQDPNIVYVIIDETANMSIWKVCIGSEPASEDLKGVALLIMQDGCISFSCSLESAPFQVKLFILRSTFYKSAVAEVLILDANMLPKVHTVEQSSIPGFSGPPYESTYFSGAADSKVHLFIHKPKGFKPGSRYPLIIMIHGGPNDAWRNSWSPTWNPILWTDQGYVVITPNIAGSTGFGLPFALSIYQSWGGRTLSDLEHLFSFIEESLSYIDPSRVIGAGYSFGGYMMNWLAGQGLAARFCAFIVHAGVFSVPNLLGGDLPTAYKPDFGCFPWEDGEKWSEWNPSKLCGNWNTPMLFTHGDMDYRIPLTESLSAYHTCQIRGIQSQLLVFPDEGHTIAKPINRSQWHETMLKWAAQWSAK
ncbi:prolyl oligopeptidase [Hyaloscypha sp. PMI_1271]|nr:prolyl oligopeptidase [Hyaloscypha sp. PMI_1271]